MQNVLHTFAKYQQLFTLSYINYIVEAEHQVYSFYDSREPEHPGPSSSSEVFIRSSSQHSEERGVLPRSPSSLLHTWEGFLITHLLHFEIIIVGLFNMKVFHHSVLNLYATSGNLPCFLLVGVTQEIVFVDLTFFITLALYTIKVDFKSNLF